jgi:hypothetical protein
MWFRKGAIVGIVATVPLVVLCALLYRFPVPLAGYLSGRDAIFPALIAVLFYGVLFGGFVVQAVLGGLGGLLAEHFAAPDKHNVKKLCAIFSTIGASFGVVFLAILDKIIGPW